MTITQLTKPVSRRINDLVVTIEQTGIRLREFKKQKSVLVPWETLDAMLPRSQRRDEAFKARLPTPWMPELNDEVYLRRTPGTVANVVGTGTVIGFIPAVPDLFVKVRVQYGGKTSCELLVLSDLRPLGRLRVTRT